MSEDVRCGLSPSNNSSSPSTWRATIEARGLLGVGSCSLIEPGNDRNFGTGE